MAPPAFIRITRAPPGNDLKEYDGAWHVRIDDQFAKEITPLALAD